MAVETAHTVGVPRPLQDVKEELIQDGLITTGAGDEHSAGQPHTATYVVGLGHREG